jgi:hypothetical protein
MESIYGTMGTKLGREIKNHQLSHRKVKRVGGRKKARRKKEEEG